MIIIYDYGVGNSGSIKNMILRAGYESKISSKKEEVEQAKFCVIPGIGAFDYCIERFHQQESSDLLLEKISLGLKTLGICVGLQMLFDSSEEGVKKGLGLIPGKVRRFDSFNPKFENKIPHMSWNYITPNNSNHAYSYLKNDAKFYFVHSYHAVCDDKYVTAYAKYGHKFPASVNNKNIYGVQFHPEKSHSYGLNFFKNFFNYAP